MRRPRPAARTMALVGLVAISEISGLVEEIISRRFGWRIAGHAIAVRHDGCATGASDGSDFHHTGRTTMRRLFLLVGGSQEIDADLIAVDPGQLAAAVGQAGRRQQQEKFLEMQPCLLYTSDAADE